MPVQTLYSNDCTNRLYHTKSFIFRYLVYFSYIVTIYNATVIIHVHMSSFICLLISLRQILEKEMLGHGKAHFKDFLVICHNGFRKGYPKLHSQ